MNSHPYSTRDSNDILTVRSSIADNCSAYVVLTAETQTPEAVEALMSPDCENMDTWSINFTRNEDTPSVVSFLTSEEEALRTATSRTWGMELSHDTTPETVSICLGVMEKGLWLEVPLTLVQSVTVEVHQTGTGAGTLEHAAGGPVTLMTATLAPLGLTLDYTYPDGGKPYAIDASSIPQSIRLPFAPIVRNGVLNADCDVFADA